MTHPTIQGLPLLVWLNFMVEYFRKVNEAKHHYTAGVWLQTIWVDPQLRLPLLEGRETWGGLPNQLGGSGQDLAAWFT